MWIKKFQKHLALLLKLPTSSAWKLCYTSIPKTWYCSWESLSWVSCSPGQSPAPPLLLEECGGLGKVQGDLRGVENVCARVNNLARSNGCTRFLSQESNMLCHTLSKQSRSFRQRKRVWRKRKWVWEKFVYSGTEEKCLWNIWDVKCYMCAWVYQGYEYDKTEDSCLF